MIGAKRIQLLFFIIIKKFLKKAKVNFYDADNLIESGIIEQTTLHVKLDSHLVKLLGGYHGFKCKY